MQIIPNLATGGRKGRPPSIRPETEHLTTRGDSRSSARSAARLAKKERTLLGAQLAELQGSDLQRLGLDLHSSIVQSLAALTANLDVVKNSGHTFDLRTRNVLEESSSIARECFQQLLALAELLCPAVVDDIGLPLAAELGSSSESRST